MRRTKEEAEKTREKVMEAALALFSRRGYSDTTLAEIAAAAGYSRGPIYWHFRNKTELYEAVMELSQVPLEQMVAEGMASERPALAALEHFVRRWLSLLHEDSRYRDSFEILLNKTELTERLAKTLERERKLTRGIIGMFQVLVERAVKEGALAADCDPPHLGVLCYTYLMGITQTWLFDPSLFDLAERKHALIDGLRRLLPSP